MKIVGICKHCGDLETEHRGISNFCERIPFMGQIFEPIKDNLDYIEYKAKEKGLI
jgi:hypothetical protein